MLLFAWFSYTLRKEERKAEKLLGLLLFRLKGVTEKSGFGGVFVMSSHAVRGPRGGACGGATVSVARLGSEAWWLGGLAEVSC
jgi:hypothetical protein